jgi:hypothetical protein
MPFEPRFGSALKAVREAAGTLRLDTTGPGERFFTGSIRLASAPLLALLTVLASATAADAGIGSWGDAIAHVGDGGHAAWMIGQSQDVGYKYSHVALLGLNLWVWDGTYCVYQRYERKYVSISSAQAAQLLGKREEDLQPPFEYRCPLGLFIFGPFLVLGAVVWVREVRARHHRAGSGTAPGESAKETVDPENRRREDLS